MVQQFLAARDSVVLCGRCERRLESALSALRADFPGAKVALPLHRDSAGLKTALCWYSFHACTSWWCIPVHT